MKAPAFQMYAADIYMDTNEWSAEAFGIYNRLLNHQWVNGSIPADMKKLAQISFVGIKKMSKCWPEMASKFVFFDSQMTPESLQKESCGSQKVVLKFEDHDTRRGMNKRLEETRQKQIQYSEMQSKKGKKRSEKMWEGHIATAKPTAINRLQPKDSSSSSSSSSNNKKNKHIVFVLPEWIKKETWEAYREMRQRKRAPLTDRAAILIIKELEKLKLSGNQPEDVLNQSIMKSWTGVFPISGGNSNGRPQEFRHDDKRLSIQDQINAEADEITRRRNERLAREAASRENSGTSKDDDVPDFQDKSQ